MHAEEMKSRNKRSQRNFVNAHCWARFKHCLLPEAVLKMELTIWFYLHKKLTEKIERITGGRIT